VPAAEHGCSLPAIITGAAGASSFPPTCSSSVDGFELSFEPASVISSFTFFDVPIISSSFLRDVPVSFHVTCSSLDPGVVWCGPDSLSSSQAILRTAKIRVGPDSADIIVKDCVEIFCPGQAVGFFH